MKGLLISIMLLTALFTGLLEAETIVSMSTGVFFGEAVGYSKASLVITEKFIIYTVFSTDKSQPPKTLRRETSKEEWADLTHSAPVKLFFSLPEVVGDPGAADGGVETLEIQTDEKNKRTTISYNTPIAGMEEYLKVIRKIRFELDKKI